MSIVNFCYHLFIFLIGALLSIPFSLLFIYIFSSKNTSHEHIHRVASVLFPSKRSSKLDILTIPTDKASFHTVWMFGALVTHSKLPSRTKLQLMYVKLYCQHLFIHLPGKRIRNLNHINRNKIFFSEVLVFDLSQAKIDLKLYEQVRTQYWSIKTPIVLSQLHFRVRYRIDKKKNSRQQDDENKLTQCLQKLVFQWLTDKDEIHLYTLTMRSKEEWFYRLNNSIRFYSKLLIEHQSDESTDYKTTRSSLVSIKSNISLDQIEIEYSPQTYSLTNDSKYSSRQIDPHSLLKADDFPHTSSHQAWPMLIKTFFERIHLFPSKHMFHHQSNKLNNDYLCLLNNIISRCNINLNIKNYFQRKIQHELKHLELPYYIHWIRISHFTFDNIYPKIENFKNIWFNHNGLWAAVDFTYQGNISIEFTIKINLTEKQKKINHPKKEEYSFLPRSFQRLLHFRDNIQVLKKIINTILIITINIRSMNGILLINIPLPPSDRIWFGFEDMPSIDFNVHHRQISENQSQSSLNTQKSSSNDLNQLQTTINHFLSQWIEKQIHKECVLPNMYDICMNWCHNPFEEDLLLRMKRSHINHLLCFNENDFENNSTSFNQQKSSKKTYLIAQWKQSDRLKFHRKKIYKYRKQKLLLPKRVFLTDTFLVMEQR